MTRLFDPCTLMPSANATTFEKIQVQQSLMYIENSKSPTTVPCGTSLVTSEYLDLIPLITTGTKRRQPVSIENAPDLSCRT